MAFLEEAGQVILNPLVNLWNSFVEVIPGLAGAILVLIIGYLVGGIVGFVIKKVLNKAKIDKLLLEKTTLEKVTGKFELSALHKINSENVSSDKLTE